MSLLFAAEKGTAHTERKSSLIAQNVKAVREPLRMPARHRPHTPSRAPAPPQPERCLFDIALSSLHLSTAPSTLPCRKSETSELTSFLQNKVAAGATGSIFVAGSPGVGKSAVVVRELRWC